MRFWISHFFSTARMPFTFQDMMRILFYGYRFCEISWLIYISTKSVCDMIGEKLEDDHFEKYIELIMKRSELDTIRIERFFGICRRDDTDHFSRSCFYLFDR